MAGGDPCVRISAYLIVFILAFWCATIAAPIMWRLEYDREHWPKTICEVRDWRCCRVSCGKNGCSYQPRWIVAWKTVEGKERTGSYYGPNTWYRPRENAEEQMYKHPIGTSFPCQYDPKFADNYRYISEPGTFKTESYLIWTIVMYSIAIPVCVLPCIGYIIYLLIKKCDCGCCYDKPRAPRTRGIAPPMSYTPPAQTQTPTPQSVEFEAPRPDPFAARADVEVPVNPVLVPLSDVPPQAQEESASGSWTGSDESGSNMPVY